MTKTILFLGTVCFLLTGKTFGQYCSSDARYTEVQYFDSADIIIGANIQYGIATDHLGNPDTLLMDLYYPNPGVDMSPRRPFIMLFHGGGFSSGDKSSGDIVDLCFQLALRGFVCASVNYRIGYDFSEYGQYKARYRAIQDGHAAMRYVVNNANAVRIDTNWIFLGGQSAGSLLALGMVYADITELDSISLLYGGTSTSAELGNLYNSGNTLTNTYTFKGIFNNWGGVTASEIDISEMLPTIAFHGELDTLVQIDSDSSFLHYTLKGSRAIHYDLIANSVCSEITIDTLGEHGIFRNASSEFRAGRASCFFKSIFCNTCSDLYTTDSVPAYCSLPLSFEDHDGLSNIRIFPNPFEKVFQIKGLTDFADLNIYNAVGDLVYQEKIYGNEVQSDLTPGIYLLTIRISESNKIFSTRLIKYE